MPISRHLGPPPDDEAAAVDDALRPVLDLAAQATATSHQRVSSSQMQALVAIRESGPLNLSSLAEALGVIPSSATRLCDRLVAADLLTRATGATDRREVMLHLTPAGARIVRQVQDFRREGLRTALEGLTERERRGLLSGLAALAAQLQDRDEGQAAASR